MFQACCKGAALQNYNHTSIPIIFLLCDIKKETGSTGYTTVIAFMMGLVMGGYSICMSEGGR